MSQGAARLSVSLSFALAAAAVLATGAGAYWNTRAVQEATRWVSHTHQVQATLEEVGSLLKDVESGERGYLLTGRADLLLPHQAAATQLPQRIAHLHALTADNPVQQQRIADLRILAAERLADSQDNLNRSRSGDRAAVIAALREGEARDEVQPLRSRLASMRDEENRLLALRLDQARAAGQRSLAFAALTTALVLALLATAFISARRGAVRLQNSREWLRVTLRSVADAVIASDTAGRVRFMNPVAERLTGWHEAQAQGRPLEEVLQVRAEDTGAPVANPAAKVLAAGVPVPLANHTLLVSRDGTQYPIANAGAPIRDDSGQVRGVVVVFVDQTAEREAALHLQASESRYRTLAEALPHLVWTADADLRPTYFSTHWREFTGWGEGEGGFERWMELIHPDDRAGFLAVMQPALGEGRAHEAEFRLRRRDGAYRRVLSRATPRTAEDGTVLQWVGTVTDVQERWQAHEDLRHTQALMQAVIEGSTALVFAKDLQGRYFLTNRAWQALAGVSPEQANGITDDQVFGPEVARVLAQADAQVVRSGQPLIAQESAVIEGRTRTYLSSKFPLREADGTVYALCGVSTDITELKQAQEEVQQLNAQLEQRVAERTRQLQDANQALEAFSYTVSHDLRAPLRGMQGFAQAVREDHADRLNAEGADYLDRIIAGARRMESLIQDLLDYGRLSREEVPLRPTNLATAVRDAVAQVEPAIARQHARIHLEPPLPPVLAHAPVLVQVLANLVGNAVKFGRPGLAPQVRIRAEPCGTAVRVWVEDDGIGIRPEHQERIFQVFERLHGQETYPGTGVGLAIVRKGCERMGGRSGVESQPGQGSRFWIELHAAERVPPGLSDTVSDSTCI